MFKEKLLDGKRIYYSDILNAEHFFTSRDFLVKENLNKISDYLKIDENNIFKPSQTHSSNVEILDINKKEYPNTDGLIFNQKNCAIYLNFADCTPVILYDNKNKIASIVHAGWRGTAGQISKVAIEKMQKCFNSKVADITAVIGPAISFECFETSLKIAEKLSLTVQNKEGLFKTLDNKHFADLKGINRQQLIELGIQKIDVCPYCTVEDNDKFFSYRKENKTLKRHSALIKI